VRPEADPALDVHHLAELLDGASHATFAIEAGPAPRAGVPYAAGADERRPLVASASLTRAEPPKFAHRARVWGVFVVPELRGRGLGRAVLEAVIAQARDWGGVDFLDLSVSANSPEARRLYESVGFAVWGREPEVTEHAGQRYDELHMTLRLPGRAAPHHAAGSSRG
jgi:GNAT superfamily N-acetyltransferase